MARRRFSGTVEQHGHSARYALQDIRRLRNRVRTYLRSPPDCVMAADMIRALLMAEGHYTTDRHYSHRSERYPHNAIRAGSKLYGRFVNACVIKPRSAAAGRRMRSVWR